MRRLGVSTDEHNGWERRDQFNGLVYFMNNVHNNYQAYIREWFKMLNLINETVCIHDTIVPKCTDTKLS